MSFTKKSLYLICFFTFFIAPGFADAQSVTLRASKTSYAINESILITASVDTAGQQINTVGGQVSFPGSSVSVSDLRFGNSIISLWVDKPTANNSAGTINFTGGTPGGYSGSSGSLFTFVVRPKQEGSLTINLHDVKVLLNDGSGGELQGLRLVPLTLQITKAPVVKPTSGVVPPVVIEKSKAPKDTISPENFIPMVSRHESVVENSYFVSFFAVDKDSGVSKYEVREMPKIISMFTDSFNTEWKETQSPYVLYFQSWGSNIEVRATDGAGNSTVLRADKPFGTMGYFMLALILVIVTFASTRFFTKRSSRVRRK